MSRGGFKGRKRLPGAEFSWQSEGRDAGNGPTPLFPEYLVPTATALSPTEKGQVDHYRKLREQIHDGPYYTVLSRPPSYKKEGPPARAQFDPFQGMASYGQRYVKKTRTLPNLRTRSYAVNFFPKELWSTLDPNYVGIPGASVNGIGPGAGRKRGFEDSEDEPEDERKRHNGGEDEGEDGPDADEDRGEHEGELEDEEEEGEEEIADDDFEEDEDDMGGDYNAEQYFDGGDEDADPFDGGGGDDGDIF